MDMQPTLTYKFLQISHMLKKSAHTKERTKYSNKL